ncbi:hypothetical protein B4Q13_21515, partial [Lacticaseibacillus rhamnosus]
MPALRRTSASSAAPCWRCGASSPLTAIPWCSRTTCGRCFRRWLRWPGTSRAARAIGERSP